jgi:23S rRNA pseudouridine2605 synthase
MERLQKIIADAGYTSRRKAEELIKQGKVYVNGKRITELGSKANSSDDIIVEGNKIVKQDKEYYLFYKPRGVVSTTSDDKGRKTVMDYFDTNKRLYPVGRLDYDTTGVLLITNDGDFANMMMHPRHQIEKTYIVKVDGLVDGYTIKKLRDGITIDGTKVNPSRVKLREKDTKNKSSIVEIIIHEGKNHEVKILFETVGFRVDKLRREAYAFLNLRGLKSGEYRKITPKEIKQLYNLANKND